MAADPNNAVFFPATLLFLLRPFSTAVRWSYGLWLVAFPLAAYAGLRRLRIGPAPAGIAAFALSISGPAMTLTSFPHVAWASMLFFPIVALARGAALGRRRDAWLAGILFGLAIDIGEPVIAFHLFLAAAFFCASRPARRWAGRVLVIGASGAAIALPQIVSAARLLPQTFRGAGLDPRFASAFNSVRPLRIFAFLWPALFGDVHSPAAAGFWGGGFFDAGVPYVTSLAVGTVSLALLPAAWRDRVGRRFVLLAAFAVLASFGRYLPGGMTLLSLPGWSMFRYPEKWLFLASYAILGAAAIALDGLASGRGRRASILGAAVLAALSFALAGILAAFPGESLRALESGRIVADTAAGVAALAGIGRDAKQAGLFAVLAAAALALLAREGRARSGVVTAVALLLFLDLFPRTWNWVPLAPPSVFDAPPPAAARVLAAGGRFYFDGETEVADDPLRPLRPAMWGVAYAGNNDIDRFSPRRSFLYGRALASIAFSDPRKTGLLRLADVKTFSAIDLSAAAVAEPLLTTSPRRTVYAIGGGSRFRMPPEALRAPGEEAARRAILDPRFDAALTVVVEGGDPARADASREPAIVTRERRADRERIRVDSAGGFLLRAETYDPHWRARVDGRPARVLPADFAFQAVAVPAGAHEVEFSYEDPATGAAMVLSLAALLLSAILLARRR
jgi:hypothetical protein